MIASSSADGGRLLRRIAAFAGLPFLSLLIPFLFLPILARVAGADAWLAIAVGQSVGAFAALVIALGYNTVGPTVVAQAEDHGGRTEELRRSLAPRVLLFVPGCSVAVAVAAAVAPAGYRLDAALMAVALALAALSSSWYLVGLGRPGLIVVYDLLPRLAATGAAAAALVFLGDVLWYPVLLIGASLIGGGAFLVRVLGRRMFDLRRGEVSETLRRNRSAMAIEVAGGAYNSLAVLFVGLSTTVAQAASYVSGDKLYRVGQYSASALGNALQGWAVEAGPERLPGRARTSIIAHGALGLLGFVAFATIGPGLSDVLFGGVIRIDEITALGFGVATAAIAIGTGLGRVVLVGLGARREFLTSVLVGAAVGVPAILILATLGGATGGAWGLALGECASVLCQAVFVIRRWPRRQGDPD